MPRVTLSKCRSRRVTAQQDGGLRGASVRLVMVTALCFLSQVLVTCVTSHRVLQM